MHWNVQDAHIGWLRTGLSDDWAWPLTLWGWYMYFSFYLKYTVGSVTVSLEYQYVLCYWNFDTYMLFKVLFEILVEHLMYYCFFFKRCHLNSCKYFNWTFINIKIMKYVNKWSNRQLLLKTESVNDVIKFYNTEYLCCL